MSSKNRARVKLNDADWKALFPGEEFRVGTTTLLIVPLSLKGLSVVVGKISKIVNQVMDLNINFDNLGQDANKVVELVRLITVEAPEVLAEMSGLDVEDVQALPLDLAVELFNKCLDVNIASQESLAKNFKGLGERIVTFMGNRSGVLGA